MSQQASTTTSTKAWQGLYLRPNPKSQGTVPASSPLNQCPDIWCAGTTAVANYQTSLASDTSYQSKSQFLYRQDTNILYVRARNGGAQTVSASVTLYFVSKQYLNSPSAWRLVLTDHGRTQGSILDVAPGQIGVCDQTFVLPVPKQDDDGWCLVAQFDDLDNGNPFPPVETVLDMDGLVQNDLGWGRVDVEPSMNLDDDPNKYPIWSYTQPLVIPDDVPAAYYDLSIAPSRFVGWNAGFYAARTDDQGAAIKLTPTSVTKEGMVFTQSRVYLRPGFRTLLTVKMVSRSADATATAGASVPFSFKRSAQQ